MSVVSIILAVALSLMVIGTALQFVRKDEWWIRLSDFPHVQMTVLTVVLMIGYSIVTEWGDWIDWVLLGFSIVAFIYQLTIIFPYTRLAKKQSGDYTGQEKGAGISILESNVYQYNSDYHRLVEEVNNFKPDIVIGLETNREWEQGLKPIEEKYRYNIKVPLDNTYGILFYSNLEIKESDILYLVDDEIPSIDATLKLRNGEEIKLYVIHPEPPSPTENPRSTERDAELIVVGQKAKSEELPVIVTGDLNDVAWSHTTRLFQRISGLMDPRIGRGFFNTFHVKYPLMRWPLDHVFHSNHFLVKTIERVPDVGSDHFPMYIELFLKPDEAKYKNGEIEDLDEDDEVEMQEKMEEVK